MRMVAVVPAFNEERTVGAAVASLRPVAASVIVVDDGSTDRTGEMAAAAGALVIRHPLNRGLGAALGTGIAAALRVGADVVVTFDADGQHRAEDLPRLVGPLLRSEADMTIGCRTLDRGKMPVGRRAANWFGNALTWMLFGRWVADSQSGLRAMTAAAAAKMDLKCDRMDVSSEFVREVVRLNLRLKEVPIVPVYTDYSLSKGQSFAVGLKTAARLIARRFLA